MAACDSLRTLPRDDSVGPMKLSPCICLAWLLVTGCSTASAVVIEPRSADVSRWIPFYTRDVQAGRLEYFYDQLRIHRSGGHVVARWKVVGSPTATTTLYVIDISCRDGTFTEKGTIIVDAEGSARELSQAERLANYPIETGTSSDVFRLAFCRKR